MLGVIHFQFSNCKHPSENKNPYNISENISASLTFGRYEVNGAEDSLESKSTKVHFPNNKVCLFDLFL